MITLSTEVKVRLAAEYGRTVRGRNGFNHTDVFVVEGTAPPQWVETAPFTEWKNGRPKKYHRATYRLNVSIGWLAVRWPASMLQAAVAGETLRIDWRDEWKPMFRIGQSLDEEGDKFYAD